jgi:ABC-type glutathione transport system ATPase component
VSALLEARGLVKRYSGRRGFMKRGVGGVEAVRGVDLTLEAGECLALVGESGSGKSTVARLVTRLLEPDEGTVRFMGEDLLALSGRALRRRRRGFQMVFQDPWGSLHPRMRVGDLVGEPLVVHGLANRGKLPARVSQLLELVGLGPEHAERWPHQLSGGQRQRVAIARALAPGPRLLVADEPVSALDISVQAQVVNLLASLQDRLGLAILLIGHDLAVVEQIAHRVAVLHDGRVVEQASPRDLLASPRHPHTVALVKAAEPPLARSGSERSRV